MRLEKGRSVSGERETFEVFRNDAALFTAVYGGRRIVFKGNILLEHIIGSGAYGTMENHMGARLLKEGGEKKQIRRTRIRLVLTMLFPPLEAMKELSPAVRRHSFLLPAAWIWRLVTKTIFANGKGREALKSAAVTEQVDQMDRVCRAAGLYE